MKQEDILIELLDKLSTKNPHWTSVKLEARKNGRSTSVPITTVINLRKRGKEVWRNRHGEWKIRL